MTPTPAPGNSPATIDVQGVLARLASILGRADHLLERAGQGQADQPSSALLDRRFSPDMFSLAQQVVVLSDSLTGAAALMTGRDVAAIAAAAWVFNRGEGLGDLPVSVPEARQRLTAARVAVTDLASDSLAPSLQSADSPIVVARPGHVRRFTLAAFVDDYVLPNAYFHLTMIHALLRQAGAPIGKADFEGPRPYTLD